MPTVPRVTRQVGTEALPGARLTAHETFESEGGALDRARMQTGETYEQLGRIGQHLTGAATQMVLEERARTDETALLEADNQLSRWENERLYNPQTGALAQKGKGAFGLPESVNGEFNDVASNIEAGLSTDRQRRAFSRVRANREASLDLTLRRHVFGEMQKFEAGELQAFVENKQSSAIANAADTDRVAADLSDAVEAIKRHAPRLGLGPEEQEQQILKVTTATHAGVISQMLEKDPRTARAYYTANKEQISGEARARIEKALDVGGLRKDAQDQTARIMTEGATWKERDELAKKIDDAELQDAVRERLTHERAVDDKNKRDTEEATLKSVYTTVDQTHDVTKIPPAIWNELDGSQRSALHGYAHALARGVPVETDLPTYYALMQQAADDPETFATQNLLNYRAKLDEGEFKQFATMQAQVRRGDRKAADAGLGDYRTKSDILEDTLTQYGIDPRAKYDTPEGKAIAQLRRMLDLRMGALGEQTGKKPTNQDIQETLDDVLSKSVTVPGSWWNIFPGGQSFFDTTKRVVDLTIDDVPATDRPLIENALRRRGRPVTDATVLDLYVETKARNR